MYYSNGRVKFPVRYTFFASGTAYSFKPEKEFFDPWARSKRITMLDFHLDLVREANSPDTYILDNKGVEVNPYDRG